MLMKKNQRNEAHKERLWNSLDSKTQKKQEKKAMKSFEELGEKARAKGALIEDKPS